MNINPNLNKVSSFKAIVNNTGRNLEIKPAQIAQLGNTDLIFTNSEVDPNRVECRFNNPNWSRGRAGVYDSSTHQEYELPVGIKTVYSANCPANYIAARAVEDAKIADAVMKLCGTK